MTSIRAEVKFNSRLSEIERRFAIPLVEIAQQLVPGMLDRIRRGQASTGSFAALGAYSVPKPGPGLFWVPPGSAQPVGYVAQPKSGKYAGWAGYVSYRAYTEALGSPARTFSATGALLSALKIRVNGPGRVKVAFYGAHAPSQKPDGKGPRTPNTAVAYAASMREPVPMLTPTREELVAIARQFQSEVGAQVISESADAQDIRKLGQRVTSLQKRMPAAFRGR